MRITLTMFAKLQVIIVSSATSLPPVLHAMLPATNRDLLVVLRARQVNVLEVQITPVRVFRLEIQNLPSRHLKSPPRPTRESVCRTHKHVFQPHDAVPHITQKVTNEQQSHCIYPTDNERRYNRSRVSKHLTYEASLLAEKNAQPARNYRHVRSPRRSGKMPIVHFNKLNPNRA